MGVEGGEGECGWVVGVGGGGGRGEGVLSRLQ